MIRPGAIRAGAAYFCLVSEYCSQNIVMKKVPTIKGIGAYRVLVTEQHIEAASIEFPPSTPKSHIRSFLERFVLVDLLVENALPDFDSHDIKQATTWSRSFFDTTFLSVDGKRVLAPPGDDLPEGIDSFRVAIYLRDFREGQPLLTPYGEVVVASVTKMPCPSGQPQRNLSGPFSRRRPDGHPRQPSRATSARWRDGGRWPGSRPPSGIRVLAQGPRVTAVER
jgi:hypothetical protein